MIWELPHFLAANTHPMSGESNLVMRMNAMVHIAKLNGRLCGAKRPHSVSEQPNFYQSLQSNPYNDSSHPSGGE